MDVAEGRDWRGMGQIRLTPVDDVPCYGPLRPYALHPRAPPGPLSTRTLHSLWPGKVTISSVFSRYQQRGDQQAN